MKFENTLNYNSEEFIIGAICVVGVIGFAIIASIILFFAYDEFMRNKKRKQGILCLLGIPVVIGITILAFPSQWEYLDKTESSADFYERSRTSLESNIMKKYNVDGVRFEGRNVLTDDEYYLSSSYAEEQAAMVIVDGNDYIFSLTQDPETFEPTLRNPPVNGGTSPDGIDADDLLKDKKD